VFAWGDNTDGQINVPAGLSGILAVAAGEGHVVALKSDGVIGPLRATATARVVNGFVVEVNVTVGGRGYAVPPTVIISGGGGTGAEATALVSDGVVTGFEVTNAGRGYTSQPQILIPSPPFTPELSIEVSLVKVNLKVMLGRKYQLQGSNDFSVWSPLGPAFVAQTENSTQEFVVEEVGNYFRVVEVP
jgi:hypothetical protein